MKTQPIAIATLMVLFLTSLTGRAELKPGETESFRWGGDLRIRATQIHRNTFSPDGVIPAGSDVQWLRFRERLWLSYDFSQDLRFDLRLAHRWHYVNSHFLDPKNQDTVTWKFPDEVIFDQLKLTWEQVADLPLTLTLGRQDVILGNGMIVLEGTAYDQGRGIYFDGVRATWMEGDDKLDLFGFYSRQTDDFWVINDRNRILRRGDTLLAGIYWTHSFDQSFNTDLYYMFNDIQDDLVIGDDVRLHIFGGRLFGQPHDLLDYSAELAGQRGSLRQSDRDMRGYMADLRLDYRLPGELPLQPRMKAQYTFMRGDDRERATYTGWHPVAAEYPIWREELMPIATRGNWTNLNQYRVEGILQLHDQVTLTGAWAYLRADTTAGYTDPFGGQRGRTMGQLYSGFVDFTPAANWAIRLEAAALRPGDYYADDTTAHWLRLETYFRF